VDDDSSGDARPAASPPV